MEFTKAQIAALVLGYLKEEKTYSFTEEFEKRCPHFGKNNQNVKIGSYLVTRVSGMRLVDFLEEYAVIYSIVQGRLELTNYFEVHGRADRSLIEQLLFLLDRQSTTLASSTPVLSSSVTSEVDATPAHTLPGNNYPEESEPQIPKTPKRKVSRSKSIDREELLNVSEALQQTLLEHHELHEKIAETINIVRRTPENPKESEENISAGASKELDAIIKTVVQRTEEDPIYHKLIDEIIGTAPVDNPPTKKLVTNFEEKIKNTSASDENQSNNVVDPIDHHNNDAVRSIIEASQSTDPPPQAPPPAPPAELAKPINNGEVYVFDGTLDTYLKSSGGPNTISTNQLYINTGGLIVMPPEATPKQFYIVNNQPMINVGVPKITDTDIMAMPTVIVNDELAPPTFTTNDGLLAVSKKGERRKKTTKVASKITEVCENNPVKTEPPVTTPSTTSSVSRHASHVRNLDFSTPSCREKPKGKAWDADLRDLVVGCDDKSPPKKKKGPIKKKKNKDDNVEKEIETIDLQTPVKDCVPKTPLPGAGPQAGSIHYTPFNDVLEEHLKGVDLISIPTPKIPITPGFALTPAELGPNQRLTDYSTSSSYYQPSDNEQNKSIEQLIEEFRSDENKSPEKFTNLKILSDVVIEKAKEPSELKKEEVLKNPREVLRKFNHNVIGKKNLSLLKRQPTDSLTSDSETESEKSHEGTNKTVICKTDPKQSDAISNIIGTVEVKNTLDEETKRKNLLADLEAKRQRTVTKLKKEQVKAAPKRQTVKNNNKKPTQPRSRKKSVKKVEEKEKVVEDLEKKGENEDGEAEKLVKGLAQRGIHLIPNKTPQKSVKSEEKLVPEKADSSCLVFDRKTFEESESVRHEEKSKKKKDLKSYTFEVLKKSMSAKVYVDDLEEEVERILKWTECESLLEIKSSPKRGRKATIVEEIEDDLMDFAIVGSPQKGGRKRKMRLSESESKQTEKKTKTYENDIKLLKNIDVDVFLDKVHGE